jgi:hypothetical protein
LSLSIYTPPVHRRYTPQRRSTTLLAGTRVPRHARKRARHAVSTPWQVSGRARARRRPVALVLLSLSPFARARPSAPATYWTCSLARARPIDAAMITTRPPSTVLVAEAPEQSRRPLDAPATPRASPRRRLQDAALAPTFRTPERPRHERPLSAPAGLLTLL